MLKVMKLLSQQPPCARIHACTTTTCTHTNLAKVAETRHAVKNTRLNLTTASSYRPFHWMNNFDSWNQNLVCRPHRAMVAPLGGPHSGGVSHPPSHTLKDGGGKLQH